MKLVIQRVIRAELWADGHPFSAIEKGLVGFVGISKRDTKKDADFLAAKLTSMRIFPDSLGKFHYSVAEAGGSILLISNFTLYADTSKGRRPSFDLAARPEPAKLLYDYLVGKVRESGLTVETGVFQAHMRVVVENDGPVTLICDSPAT